MKNRNRSILSVLALAMTLGHGAMAAPATVVQSVTYNSETITMRMDLQNLRGANFELWSQNASGTYDVVSPVDERSYIGTVDEYPGAVSCGILQDDGQFRGAVYFDRGVTWFTLATAVVETRALDYGTFSSFQIPGAPTVGVAQAGSAMYGFELGVDADHDYYTTAGSSVAKAFEQIEYSVCVMRAIYMRDALLRMYLGRVIIRATLAQDPYTGLTQGNYLDAVRAEWNNNQTSTDPAQVAGVSPTKIGGGLAWVGVVGTSSAYSVNQSGGTGAFDVVARHELGHNWDCGHFVGGSPEGTGLMGGNAAGRMSGCEVYRVLNHRNAKISAGGIVNNEGAYTGVELPPYASMDVATFTQTVDTNKVISVLANDHDANGQTLSLDSFDSTSAQGGTITQQGQDLVYTAPGNYLGTDYFKYVVTDTAGKTAMGVVVIDVSANDTLKLYLALDETAGTAMDDKSVFNHTGSAENGATVGVAGQFGNAVTMDGVDDRILASNINLNSDTVTLSAWLKRPVTQQNDFSGIIFNGAGLNFGTAEELRYHWNGTNWGWNSGLVPPANQWVFVALVIEPTKATIYMHDGTTLQSAVNAVAHSAEEFTGTTSIGSDPARGDRNYTGDIDDVRIYSEALTQAQILNLVSGGSAEAPSPFDGASDVASSIVRWAPGATAISYEVYVGTNATAVGNATTASPEYQGSTTSALYVASLSDQTEYFWRVDTVTASTTLAGSVWSFETGTVPTPGNSILVNFDQGAGEAFAGGALIGPTGVDSSNWNAASGASGSLFGLTDSAGAGTAVDGQWNSANTWTNNDGTADDEHKLAVGYLDDPDGSNGDGKGVIVTLSNIPYASYKVYGLFATDQNGGGSSGTVNFNVNGTWALGGDASTTAAAWGSVTSNNTANGNYWTEIDPGVSQGNYWVVESSGATCTITGELGNGSSRGCLTGVIIEEIAPQGNNAPTWTTNPVNESDATEDAAYASTLANDASDPDSDPITFLKVSGPAWLSVAANGALSGTPSSGDVGSNQWTVRVTDDGSLSADATLNITVNGVNHAPSLANSAGADAEDGVAYSDSIAGSGSDPDAGDTLTYSKVSGPVWLTVAGDGGLSGTPGSGDVGNNQWAVRVTDTGGLTADATLDITVNAAPPGGDTTYNATGETTATGSASGGFAATTASDNSYETLTETVTGGNPSKRRSQLEHEWTFNVTSGIATTLRVEAHHTVNSEGDDFIFAYSTDGSSYTDVLTVTKTSDDDVEQTASLPSGLSGTVYIRVIDADNSQGNSVADTLSVDLLAIDVTPLTGPPAAAANPSPGNGASGTSLSPTLTWDAAGGADSYDVYFGTTAPGALQGNQAGTSFAPGTLLASTAYYWRVDTVNGNGTTTGTAWSFTTGAGGSSTLFSDDFESGNLNNWSTSGNVSANTGASNGGTYGARLRNSASMTATIDASAASSVDLSYDRRTNGLDSGETLTIEWSDDGSTWNPVESTSSTSWGTTDVTLPAGAAGQSALRIRFTLNANRNNETGYVDNVTVTGS